MPDEEDALFREQLLDQMDKCSTEWSVIDEEPNVDAPNTLTPLVEEKLMSRKPVTFMPWEIEGWNFIFGGVDDDVEIGDFSEVGIYDALSLHVKEPVGNPSHSKFAKQRLRIARLVQCEDHLRWMALLKFRNLVLAEPSVTPLGQSLLDKSGRMVMETEISSVFAEKSTATLAKRASALWRYAQWVAKNGMGILSVFSVCVFSLCFLSVFSVSVFSLCFLSVFSLCVFCLCVFCVFSLCVFSLCFLSVFSVCVFSLCVFCLCVFPLCFLSVFSVCVFSLCVFCLCFLSGFAFYRTTKNDTFLSMNFDIILLWSGLADQLLFADINTIKGWWSANSQLI